MSREHRCLSCRRVDEGPNATCTCMEPGDPCGICGYPEHEPLTHEWIAVDDPELGNARLWHDVAAARRALLEEADGQ